MNPRRKAHSSGGIAFSWEDKPGVPKALHNHVPQKSRPTIAPPPTTTENLLDESSNMKIPLPPCGSHYQPPPRRRTFWNKAFRRHRDPFLVAYNHCAKTPTFDNKIGLGFNSIATKTKLRFSCKSSADARDDHFLKPSMAPRLSHASNP
ncbi:hypothetical protein K1719_029384 [Acacia pycnantha]|nr:hypothetical protein K1719_029384 [Acacia pycnantha]